MSTTGFTMTRRAALLAGGAIIAGGARAQGSAAPVVVSSKIDTEGALLGNLILLALGQAGVPTTARLALCPSRIVRTALLAGEIDIYP